MGWPVILGEPLVTLELERVKGAPMDTCVYCGGVVQDDVCTVCGRDAEGGSEEEYGSVAYSEENLEEVWEILDEAEEEEEALAGLGFALDDSDDEEEDEDSW